MLCFACKLELLSRRLRERDIVDAADSSSEACNVTAKQLVGACCKKRIESWSRIEIRKNINQMFSSYFALVCNCSSLTVFTVGWAIMTFDRAAAVALLDRRLSFIDADVLLLTLSNSLNFGVIPVVGRTTF